jgi:hypothetical protein
VVESDQLRDDVVQIFSKIPGAQLTGIKAVTMVTIEITVLAATPYEDAYLAQIEMMRKYLDHPDLRFNFVFKRR